MASKKKSLDETIFGKLTQPGESLTAARNRRFSGNYTPRELNLYNRHMAAQASAPRAKRTTAAAGGGGAREALDALRRDPKASAMVRAAANRALRAQGPAAPAAGGGGRGTRLVGRAKAGGAPPPPNRGGGGGGGGGAPPPPPGKGGGRRGIQPNFRSSVKARGEGSPAGKYGLRPGPGLYGAFNRMKKIDPKSGQVLEGTSRKGTRNKALSNYRYNEKNLGKYGLDPRHIEHVRASLAGAKGRDIPTFMLRGGAGWTTDRIKQEIMRSNIAFVTASGKMRSPQGIKNMLAKQAARERNMVARMDGIKRRMKEAVTDGAKANLEKQHKALMQTYYSWRKSGSPVNSGG